MKRLFTLCLSVYLLLPFMSCKRIELYEYNTRIYLDLLVDLCEDSLQSNRPTHVEVLLYHPKNGKMVLSQILSSEGGEMKAPSGEYEMVVYSLGTEMTQVNHLSHKEEAEAFTSDVSLLYADLFKMTVCNDSAMANKGFDYSYEQDPIVYSPDHVYVSSQNYLSVPSFLDPDNELIVRATATSIVEVYSLEVYGVQALENIRRVDAFVSGQVKSCFFARPETSMESTTLYVPMSVDYEENRLFTVFGTFGKYPGAENKVYLDIILTTYANECFRYVYDVTEQFDDEENVQNRLIIVDSIDVPEGSSSGPSFSFPVNPWEGDTLNINFY